MLNVQRQACWDSTPHLHATKIVNSSGCREGPWISTCVWISTDSNFSTITVWNEIDVWYKDSFTLLQTLYLLSFISHWHNAATFPCVLDFLFVLFDCLVSAFLKVVSSKKKNRKYKVSHDWGRWLRQPTKTPVTAVDQWKASGTVTGTRDGNLTEDRTFYHGCSWDKQGIQGQLEGSPPYRHKHILVTAPWITVLAASMSISSLAREDSQGRRSNEDSKNSLGWMLFPFN